MIGGTCNNKGQARQADDELLTAKSSEILPLPVRSIIQLSDTNQSALFSKGNMGTVVELTTDGHQHPITLLKYKLAAIGHKKAL